MFQALTFAPETVIALRMSIGRSPATTVDRAVIWLEVVREIVGATGEITGPRRHGRRLHQGKRRWKSTTRYGRGRLIGRPTTPSTFVEPSTEVRICALSTLGVR